MPLPKATRKTSTTAVSSQPSLKASFAAARNAKSAVVGEKKKSQTVVTPTVLVVATPSPDEVAAVPKKVSEKRESITDEDSEEDDYEPISPIVDSDDDVVEVSNVMLKGLARY